MAQLQWTPALSVGIPRIDDQHKKLIFLISQMEQAMTVGKGKEVLADTLRQLTDYAKMHFQTEECYMTQFNYDGYISHKKEHEEFQCKIAEFEKDFTAGNIALSVGVFIYLNKWLTNHIKVADRQYVPTFKQNLA